MQGIMETRHLSGFLGNCVVNLPYILSLDIEYGGPTREEKQIAELGELIFLNLTDLKAETLRAENDSV